MSTSGASTPACTAARTRSGSSGNDRFPRDLVPGLRQQRHDGAAAAVGRLGAGIAHRHDGAACRAGPLGAVRGMAHAADYTARGRTPLPARRRRIPRRRVARRRRSSYHRRVPVEPHPVVVPEPRSFPLPRLACLLAALSLGSIAGQDNGGLDAAAQRWVDDTLRRLTLDEKIGQLVVSSFRAAYVSSDSETYDDLAARVGDQRVGGLIMFGARTPQPDVPAQSELFAQQPRQAARRRVAHQPAAGRRRRAAAHRGRLRDGGRLPAGGRHRVSPPAMAFGAADDPRLAFEAGRIAAAEARAMGVHVNFAPVVDVNNNPRNPVINIRLVRRGSGAGGRAGGGLRRGAAGGRDARHGQSTSRATATRTWTRTSDCRSSTIRASASTASSWSRSGPASPPGPTR